MNNPPQPQSSTRSQEADANITKLKEKLYELFQLNRGDLDFGLYRIMAMKSKEIKNFLDEHLLPQITEALGEIAEVDIANLQKEIDDLEKKMRGTGVALEHTPKFEELKKQQQAAKQDQQIEADTYNHLYNFFARYYHEGDFMSLRRYKGVGKEAYLVPYNGEEVKLHWANSDQYYIKTTENYASYVFLVGDGGNQRRVRFQIAEADNEKDHIKETKSKQRFFILAEDPIGNHPPPPPRPELIIRFAHRPLSESEKAKYPGNATKIQASINRHAEKVILKKIKKDWLPLIVASCPTETDKDRTLLGKHLAAYSSKNSFDYFIHKDIGGFLRRELDNYLKSDVLSIDNLQIVDDSSVIMRSLSQVKAIKNIGYKIIEFIAQLENFQKQLWLKKKFILETQYCVTLDKIPESFYEEIAKNKKQHAEWVELFAIDEINGDHSSTPYSKSLKSDFLKENPYLVLDTKHFDQIFTDKLLTALSQTTPLAEQMNGVLVHGENFQALNLLQSRYQEQVKCVYIDPPYNTNASSILYKNGYKDSSWMSLMEDRLLLAHAMLVKDGIICAAIDDEEVSVLRALMKKSFEVELGVATVRSNPAGRKTKGRFAPAHEYALFYGKAEGAVPGSLKKTEKQIKSYPHEDDHGRFMWTNLVRSGTNDKREDAPRLYYPIFVDNNHEIRISSMNWSEENREWIPQDSPAKDETVIYPFRKIGGNITEGNWHRGHQRLISEPSEYRVRKNSSGKFQIDFKKRMDENALPKTWWDKGAYQSANGTTMLKGILGDKKFDFPKSTELVKDCILASINSDENINVLDYFAGSGTTGHAVIDINREDDGDRRYILVEMGQHFDAVLLPRMKKVIYAKDWKDGKPKNQTDRQGVSQLFQYIQLESYEDTMDSLIVDPRDDLVAQAENKEFVEDYQLRYALGEETAQSASLVGKDFINPFNYTLSVVRDGIRREVKADIVETFNFLLGLKINKREWLEDVLTITGVAANGDSCLILWRNLEETDAKKLNEWFDKHRENCNDDLNLIYVNGDHLLNNRKKSNEMWEANTTEPVFRELMFGEWNN